VARNTVGGRSFYLNIAPELPFVASNPLIEIYPHSSTCEGERYVIDYTASEIVPHATVDENNIAWLPDVSQPRLNLGDWTQFQGCPTGSVPVSVRYATFDQATQRAAMSACLSGTHCGPVRPPVSVGSVDYALPLSVR
jgi:hypothetical protein